MTKIGGEKSGMMIPSYETLKGIVSSMYWKPSFNWVIESVKVLNPIRTERKGIRPIKYNGGNDLSYYTYLSDVAYIISAHFEFNKREDLIYRKIGMKTSIITWQSVLLKKEEEIYF